MRKIRRPFAVAMLIAFTAAITACGGDDDSASRAGEEASGDFDPSRSVRVIASSAPTVWDPAQSTSVFQDTIYMTQVYDRLIYINPEGQVEPMLATDWEFSDDALTVTMNLRDDVTFADGEPFDADVAVANIERNQAEDSAIASLLESVDTATATDQYTLQVTLVEPNTSILYTLGGLGGMMVSPAAFDDPELATNPVGSGPYRLVSFDGTSTTLERNPDYWNDQWVLPEEKIILNLADSQAGINALQTGQADIGAIRLSDYPQVEPLLESGELEETTYQAASSYALLLNTSIPPLDDPDVRTAINLAIDRETINETIMNGLCPPAGQPLPEGFPGHVEDLAFDYDVEEATRLVEEAGATGSSIDVIVVGSEPQISLGDVLQQSLQEIGLTLNLVRQDSSTFRSEWRTGNYAGLMHRTNALNADPLTVLDSVYLGPDSPGGENEELAAILDEAKDLEIGSPERQAVFEEASRFTVENPTHALICFEALTFAHDPLLQNADAVPNAIVSNFPDTARLIFGRE